ncbi:hypothetical protein FACS1894180_7960 [Bacteroidia bacterium]|nr:hypothetical protein FACS1894180_7960 [Bacteroidia bacterium]
MNTQPLFSILMAQYNNGRFLQTAVESVFAQTYTNWEIIIVDDCSTDNSAEYYELYKDNPRIKIFFNEKNGGEGFTKRNAAAHAKGELCGFLDPDDALLPNALQDMVEVHRANPQVSVVFSRMYMCGENLNIKGESRKLVIAEGKNYFTNKDFQPEHFVSFKKSFYDKTEGIDGRKRMAADQDMYTKLEEMGEVYVLDKFTLKYRIHAGGLSVGKSMNKTWFWNFIVRYETCVRRGLSIDEYAVQGFLDFVEQKEKYQQDLQRAVHSKAYRLGKFLLKPLSLMRQNILISLI